MMQSSTADHIVIAAFVLIGIFFVFATLQASHLLARSKRDEAKLDTYECGSEPLGPPWVQFRIGYYVYALLFVVFDIETVFLYPWAVAFGRMGVFIVVEMFIFIAILAAGLAYAWKEGALKWR
jgi:NADH-quinone oxidoreductase subunit A